ncbi:MAG TPA: hypothetical protein V6C78_13720 [Crinalium sp.]|jgi:hypothetical protein
MADRILPKAKLVSSRITAQGTTSFSFKVVYTDNLGLKKTSINSRNLLVTGPNGFRQVARLVGKPRLNKKGTKAIATYRILAPGGSWDFSDNGLYNVSVIKRRISDNSRNFVKPGKLGKGILAAIPNPGPTAALGSGTTGAGDYTFTVTYSDNTAVNAASLDSSDIQVTGPNGFSQLAQLVSVTPAGNGTPLTATYRINSPNSVWTSANDGAYAISLLGNQVTDTLGTAATATSLGSFNIASTTIPPSARLTGSDIANSGATTYDFTVTYADNEAVNVTTLGTGDVRVTGPNGFNQLATFVGVDANSNGTPRNAIYRITAPGGKWDGADAGSYSVSVEPGQVSDLLGNTTPSSTIGSFAVTIENTAPTASLAGAPVFNLDSGAAYVTIAFSDNAGINAASLNSLNVRITGPNGYNQLADFVRVNPAGNGGALTATYRINAPGGSWDGDALEDGTYSVSLLPNQVSDINGNVAAQTAIGEFQVLLKPFRLQAEALQLTNYVTEASAIASGGTIIRLNTTTGQDVTGTATTTFNGPAGTYDLVVGYFDENDGTSEVKLLVNGVPVPNGTWQFNKNFETSNVNLQSFARYSISGVQLSPGATITLQGKQVAPGTVSTLESARLDYIDFIPVSNTSSPASNSPGAILGTAGDNTVTGNGSVNTVDYSQLSKGIIAYLDQNTVFKPVYGGLETPKIMPMGDSITLGQHTATPTSPGAYRIQLRNQFLANGLDLNFVGSQDQSGVSGLGGDTQNEAYTGTNNTLQQMKDNVVASGAFPTNNPDVVLLIIGSANTGSTSLVDMKSGLEQLIDSIMAKLSPNAQLLVGSIPPANTTDPLRNQLAADYNALIPGIVGNAAAAGKNVSFVDINSALSTGDLISDGINLTSQGHVKVGNKWFDALVDKDSLTGIQNIVGTGLADVIVGNSSANVIEGGRGADTLTGGGSGDTFVYRGPNDGADTITDFGTGDILQISASGFGGGLVAGVALASGAASATGTFVSGSTRVGTSANFLYSGGVLSFDPDGTGAQGAVAIATLTGSPALTANRISIIA